MIRMERHMNGLKDLVFQRFIENNNVSSRWMKFFAIIMAAAIVLLWWWLYQHLHPASKFLTYSIFNIRQGTHVGHALEFFFYDLPKVMMLLTLVVLA